MTRRHEFTGVPASRCAGAHLSSAQSIADDLLPCGDGCTGCLELGNELLITQSLVLDALEGSTLEVTVGKELSSVVAVLRRGRAGRRAGAAGAAPRRHGRPAGR